MKKPARQLSQKMMQRFGIFVTRWSFAETCVNDLFAILTKGDQLSMMVVTANVSSSTICGWTNTLLDTMVYEPIFDKIREAIKEIDALRSDRNALVHGSWVTSGPRGSAIVQTIRLDRSPAIKEELVTAADLDDLIDRVNHLIVDLRTILQKLDPTS
jgi:hypothetical protein